MIIPSNWVLIKPDPDDTEIKCGDVKLKLAGADFRQAENFQRWGTVMCVPKKLVAKDGDKVLLEWTGDIEIKEGDRGCYDYLAALSASGNMYDYSENKDMSDGTFFLKYTDLYMKLQEDVIPLNGYVLIEPVYERLKSDTIETLESKNTVKGVVLKAGSLVKYTKDEFYCEDTDELKEGDVVLFRPGSDYLIEDDLHRRTEKKICAIQRKRIMAII